MRYEANSEKISSNHLEQVDVGLDKVMPNGAGLTHSSFCVAEIARSKLHCKF
jgi:hypothetical protein